MAKYVPMDLLKSLRGKVCGHSDTYFAERYGTKYTGKICNPSTKEATELQIAQREKFATARANAKALSDEQKQAYATAFKSYSGKYKSLNGYIFAKELEKLG